MPPVSPGRGSGRNAGTKAGNYAFKKVPKELMPEDLQKEIKSLNPVEKKLGRPKPKVKIKPKSPPPLGK